MEMRRILCVFTALAAWMCGAAETFEYTYRGATLRYESIDDVSACVIDGNGCEGEIVIPEKVNSNSAIYDVTKIGERAFSGCAGLTSIYIPSSVTFIGARAFENCVGLEDVNIGYGVKEFGTINGTCGIWAGCGNIKSITYLTDNVAKGFADMFDVVEGPDSGWIEGYMVGTVAPEVETVKWNTDIEWTATPTLDNTLVIGQTPDTKNISQCIVVKLPQGSALREFGALRGNPENYQKKIVVYGEFEELMGMKGLAVNGMIDEFSLDGMPVGNGDGTEDAPYCCAQVIAMRPPLPSEAIETDVWVRGYVVGYMDNLSSSHLGVAKNVYFNILISDSPNACSILQCVCVQLPLGDVRDALNLVKNPDLLGQMVSVRGDVTQYMGWPGIKGTHAYKIESEAPATDIKVRAVADVTAEKGTRDNPFSVLEATASTANIYSTANLFLFWYVVPEIEYVLPWTLFRNVVPVYNGIEDIDGTDDAANDAVEVYNLSGVKVYEGSRESMSLPAGLYILRTASGVEKIAIR